MIFVFGSNLAGRHGKGAALFARKNKGAIYGVASGLQGNSYAIPTKGRMLEVLSLSIIKSYVDDFISFAKENPEMRFEVTRVGCGLAGYNDKQMAPLFRDAPRNCLLDPSWINVLERL